jgi:LacI family transcriptional regulator
MVDSEKIGSSKHSHAMHRGNAFVTALRQKGLKCSVFDLKKKYPSCGKPLPTLAWVSEQIRRWLTTLPKPLALFCVNDYVGLWVCELCRRAGIHIPEKVAVLGVDDDDMFCNMVYPHLSSIAVPAEQVGYEAAKMMDDIICDPRTAKRPTLLKPLGVVMRHSTDIMAIDDRDVIKAVRFIRENAHKGINVTSVMAKMRLPRRMLERRFKKALGRSPFAEIRRLQIERIKMILAQTNTAIEDIATDCGFKSVTRMTLAFKRATGIPPGKYRRLFQKK